MKPALALLLVMAACDVGELPTNPGAPDAGIGSPDSGAGGGPGSLQVTFTTSATPGGGQYAPKNIVSVWIENQGAFVKTIGRWAATRKQHLVAWNLAAGTTDADAISGATRANHTNALSISWNLQDKQNTVIADGTYTVRMELTDLNANTAGQNNQGTFTFIKGGQPQTQTALANGGFSAVSIQFTP